MTLKTKGLLALMDESSVTEWKPITKENCEEIINSFKQQSISNTPVIFCGEFMGRVLDATAKNDKKELSRLSVESDLKYKIDCERISKLTGIPFDLCLVLNKNHNWMRNNLSWELYSNRFSENEYDDSSEHLDLIFDKGEFRVKKYWSDGYYGYKEIVNEVISFEDTLRLIKIYLK